MLLAAGSPSAFLGAEESGAERFAGREALLAALLRAALSGTAPLVLTGRPDGVRLTVEPAVTAQAAGFYDVAAQEAHGAWYLPRKPVRLRAGLVNLASHYRSTPRFAMTAAEAQWVRVEFATSPMGLFLWSAAEALFEALFKPLELRSDGAGVGSLDERRAAWSEVAATYAALGIDPTTLAALGLGSGWSRQGATERLAAKQGLLAALCQQPLGDIARRWRALSLQPLVQRYYEKAVKKPPTQKQVLASPVQRVMVGWFGGDWLDFLAYIEEQPAPNEQITTALPEPHLYVEGAAKAPAVAATQGIPLGEVERIIASFTGAATAQSPVERRVSVLRSYWQVIDGLHAVQRPGTPSLAGLVEETSLSSPSWTDFAYLDLLPPDLVADIDVLWDAVTLPQFSAHIVTATHPHKLLADALGPALSFWHGVALSAWFTCEGPWSRTSLDEMEDYYRRDLSALDAAGFPVSRDLFSHLKQAERKLGKPQPITKQVWSERVAGGITLSASMGMGSRREGFTILRDIITQHRRAWTLSNLERYLRWRWDAPLRATAEDYNRIVARTGRPPAKRQFATVMSNSAGLWFDGELASLATALGLPCPIEQTRARKIPADRRAFVRAVYAALGGTKERETSDTELYNRNWGLRHLAGGALRFVQLWEAMGEPPDMKAAGGDRIHWDTMPGVTWDRYVETVQALVGRAVSPVGSGVASVTPSPATAPAAPPPVDSAPHQPVALPAGNLPAWAPPTPPASAPLPPPPPLVPSVPPPWAPAPPPPPPPPPPASGSRRWWQRREKP